MSIVYQGPTQAAATLQSLGVVPSVHEKPATPSAEDDEFDGSTVPTAWNVMRFDNKVAVPMTVGVAPFTPNNSIATGAQWQMGYRRSCLTVQPVQRNGTGNPEQWLWKPLQTPVQFGNLGGGQSKLQFRARIMSSLAMLNLAPQGGQGGIGFYLAQDDGSGKPDILNYFGLMMTSYINANTATIRIRQRFASLNSGNVQDIVSYTLNDWARTFAQVDHFSLARSPSGGVNYGFGGENLHYIGSNGGTDWTTSLPNTTAKHVAIHMSVDGASGIGSLVHVDYFRKYTGEQCA